VKEWKCVGSLGFGLEYDACIDERERGMGGGKMGLKKKKKKKKKKKGVMHV